MEGIYPIYKPKGPTSYKIIDKIKKITGKKKVGHGGTLDPLASGVLIVAIGRSYTKKISSIVKEEKEYIATIKLGETSDTDDKGGEIEKREVLEIPKKKDIEKILPLFQGKIIQRPPIFSALKIKGTPSYKLARKGKSPKLSPREVLIKKIEIIDFSYPMLNLRTVTGPGVYIRSLARDIGEKLKTGGRVEDLERVRVGKYKKEDCLTLEELKSSLKIKGKED